MSEVSLLNSNDIEHFTPSLQCHIRGAEDHLRNDSDELRKCSPEQLLYREYEEAQSPHGPALYAVKGEHWNGVSPAFLAFLNSFQLRREHMGYAECGYGIQRHRDFMRRLIEREHHLTHRRPAAQLQIDVGCFSMTTRLAMYDLAKVAFKHAKAMAPHKTPIALVPTPSWDYRGIVKDVGFEVVYLPIRPTQSWQPNLDEWQTIATEVKERDDAQIALTISNPQHNPTGMQWPDKVTEWLVRLAAAERAYFLLDDAYYNVHDPRVPVGNGLKTVLNVFDESGGDNAVTRAGMFDRWMATRPFGKQFSCNTMAVAAITTSPKLLRQLARESWINRYHCNTHNAEIMCAWLATPDAAEWTWETGLFYARQKELVRHFLVEQLGWPNEAVCVGPSSSYMMFEVPKIYQSLPGAIDHFRDDLFYATGTLVSASLFNQASPAPYVRLHLGSHQDVVEEFLRRWRTAGLRYDQPRTFPGKAALNRSLPPLRYREERDDRASKGDRAEATATAS